MKLLAFSMPNWSYLAINFLYQVGLALWIGGSIALGALVAPALFKALPRAEAGAIFGPTLRRFSRLRVIAVVLIITGAAAKYVGWERNAESPWIAVRWVAIALLALTVVYEIAYLEPAMERNRGDAAVFGKLHHRAELLMKSALVVAIVALFLS
ncbi:MAG TPA: DUF4149 domain-containing protein [Thermoanaerobaculia bacterium]|nr:DUF4149 domain-containing protein [Thermoanaerobaculia bacterium]